MKSNLNRVSRLNYSNATIALRCGVSVKLIHNCRKKFNPLVDKAIKTHFFSKAIHFPAFTPKLVDTITPKESFLKKFLYKLQLTARRFITTPLYKGYNKFAYKA
jgi:hypothetical protein